MLDASMAAFSRMYEARADTVVLPRDVVPAKEFAVLGEIVEDEEHRWFGGYRRASGHQVISGRRKR